MLFCFVGRTFLKKVCNLKGVSQYLSERNRQKSEINRYIVSRIGVCVYKIGETQGILPIYKKGKKC